MCSGTDIVGWVYAWGQGAWAAESHPHDDTLKTMDLILIRGVKLAWASQAVDVCVCKHRRSINQQIKKMAERIIIAGRRGRGGI